MKKPPGGGLMRINLILVTLLLSGCATAKLVPLPNGEQGYAISKCDDIAECYRKAAKVCGGKYEILSQSNESTGALSGGVGFMVPQYTITVSCPDKH
jgi:hypothetical protein